MNKEELLNQAKSAAREAGSAIMEIYETGDFSVEAKADNSPLTIADRTAHEIIAKRLSNSGLPILSEEGRSIPFDERKAWDAFWMVDPLDGTKEFIKKNGEFTVNIALIERSKPTMGIVYAPALDELFYGREGDGAYREDKAGQTEKMQVNGRSMNEPELLVVASRSHLSPETEGFMNQLHDPKIVSKGSSLKLVMVAGGEADLYPRYAPTMEWDTAAAHFLVTEAGGVVLQAGTNQALEYNKEDLLNPFFLCSGCKM